VKPASLPHWLQRNLTRIVACLLVVFLFFQTRLPDISASEAARLSSHFHFAAYSFPVSSGVKTKSVRAVHPSLKRLSAWISSVGSAVAVGDLDGDGLSNDVCLGLFIALAITGATRGLGLYIAALRKRSPVRHQPVSAEVPAAVRAAS
jgi:hypothetical protein